jgi:hypothetical protein
MVISFILGLRGYIITFENAEISGNSYFFLLFEWKKCLNK